MATTTSGSNGLGACGWQEYMSLRLLEIEEREMGKMHDTVASP